ncbi:MAG TPA: ATP-grasp domain-containing protein [Bacillota bacterium]|nr:ATP-grasp domain-containing protein [Bacillota bacterium]
MQQSPRYLLVVEFAPASLFEVVKQIRQRSSYANLEMVVLTSEPSKYATREDGDVPLWIVPCAYNDDQKIDAALAPFRDQITGVICRGDKQVQQLRRVLPFLPPNVQVSSDGALAASVNKRLMRADFAQHFPEITPHFIEVHDDSAPTVGRVEAALSYPVIVKPANLASSILIQSCHDRAQLQTALKNIFAEIVRIYKAEGRHTQPQVIVEEYLEGDFYSIDAYVRNAGELQYLPPVAYIPAKQLGIDDFFLYKRFVPTKLTAHEIEAANQTVAKAIASVGLVHSSAHVELVLTKHGWRVIELGPRLGRFRHTMYKHAYGIDHSLNDTLLHLGELPHVGTPQLKAYCSAYSIYPHQEGVLREITGLDFLYGNPAVSYLRVTAQSGDYCHFAKNGGHSLAEFVVNSADKKTYDELIRHIEQNIAAVIEK